jgi:hypothetical protein
MEQWKNVVGYEGLYLISSHGRVFSVRSNRTIKTAETRGGYYNVELNLNGKSEKKFVHRLVAEAFIENPHNFPIVNHKDENPSNNHVENLEWCTYKYNVNYGDCIEKRVRNTRRRRGADAPNSKNVYQFDLNGNLVAEYVSCAEAAQKTGFSHKSISKGCTGRLKVYKGYVWSYDGTFKLEPKKRTPRRGAVLMYDKDGNILKRYKCAADVALDGFNVDNVRQCCTGAKKSHAGYVWRYENKQYRKKKQPE